MVPWPMGGQVMTDNPWQGKRVMITGVCGTVGGELLRQILALDVAEVVGIDVNEAEIYYLRQRMPDNVPAMVDRARPAAARGSRKSATLSSALSGFRGDDSRKRIRPETADA